MNPQVKEITCFQIPVYVLAFEALATDEPQHEFPIGRQRLGRKRIAVALAELCRSIHPEFCDETRADLYYLPLLGQVEEEIVVFLDASFYILRIYP